MSFACLSLNTRLADVQVTYDVMDVDAPGFEADFSTFRDVIRELERRLGALIMQVWQCCWGCSVAKLNCC